MALVAQGWTDQRIGRALGITSRTVRKHLTNAREKSRSANRAEAAAWWTRHRPTTTTAADYAASAFSA